MNEKYLEIVQKINELTSTMSEAFDHIMNVQIPQLRFEDSFYLLNDIIEAFLSISSALRVIQDEFDVESLQNTENEFQERLSELLQIYKQPLAEKLLAKYQNEIIPVYEKWQTQLLSAINKYQA
ncbi:hypothetical protein B0S90_1823 [Caldicellulosiruptor bescii]|uniref:DUF8042 domain-containing protein n=2 Tax=Caldicellulosiruptor bescii TaxID=31899 RepID=B9MJW7_CALBD|nr:hypothetical protein [Caldicellulosiruptor bescii]ACM60625.1 conserved hypothetical protein [Caldicellulosiruptor bescii DSM 6725]PBC88034.1 hypothetical protein B0S87_0963 [Caldicellulosiruptor bescii]PBC90966.1 hypothetical protein B0S89_1325 [Caldicellulosiruptor bescii]PBD03601.1 hypothetical protein B0S85_1214 [Caldicellulosiruptor bescii]PBD06764.1 hypothetical protein B0S90_1823 [Caldicellulosiruptor bescii]